MGYIRRAASPKMNVPSVPSERVTLPPPLEGESRVEIAIPVRPSLHTRAMVIVWDWFKASYVPAHVSFPSVTEKLPPARETVFSPRKICPFELMTATGIVWEQAGQSNNSKNGSSLFGVGGNEPICGWALAALAHLSRA